MGKSNLLLCTFVALLGPFSVSSFSSYNLKGHTSNNLSLNINLHPEISNISSVQVKSENKLFHSSEPRLEIGFLKASSKSPHYLNSSEQDQQKYSESQDYKNLMNLSETNQTISNISSETLTTTETKFRSDVLESTETELDDNVSLTEEEELTLINGVGIDYRSNETQREGVSTDTLISAPGCPL